MFTTSSRSIMNIVYCIDLRQKQRLAFRSFPSLSLFPVRCNLNCNSIAAEPLSLSPTHPTTTKKATEEGELEREPIIPSSYIK